MSAIYLAPVLDDISEEGDRARSKFGDQFSLTDLEWLAVLAEEFGEVAKIICQKDVPPIFQHPQIDAWTRQDVRRELLQVAAVAARWIAAIDENRR